MRPWIRQVASSGTIPARVDVAVIGAGIVGCMTAYELAAAGHSVAVFEKGVVAGEQSGRNWGWVRRQNRAYSELELATLSRRRWGELGDELGADLGYRQTGILFCTHREAELARWAQWLDGASQFDLQSELLSGSDATRRAGGRKTWHGGVWSPLDGIAEPALAAPTIAEGAMARGATLHQGCAVRGLDVVAGAVRGVWTERGLVGADAVVAAGGAWNGRICRDVGIHLPVVNVEGTTFRTTPGADLGLPTLSTPGFAARRRLDGSYNVAVPGHGVVQLAPHAVANASRFLPMFRSNVAKRIRLRLGSGLWRGPDSVGRTPLAALTPFEHIRMLEPRPDRALVRAGLAAFIEAFPELAGAAVQEAWAGLIDTTPDLVPIISHAEARPGLVIASGFSGHGFALAPGAGRVVAEMVRGEPPSVTIHPFRLGRFTDGSVLPPPGLM